MAIATSITQFLSHQGLPVHPLHHHHTRSTFDTACAAHIPADQVAKAVVLKDRLGHLSMAVIPASHKLQIMTLNMILHKQLRLADEQDLYDKFGDCQPGAIPPMAMPYGMEWIVDKALSSQPTVYCGSGDHGILLKFNHRQFQQLIASTRSADISNPKIGNAHQRDGSLWEYQHPID